MQFLQLVILLLSFLLVKAGLENLHGHIFVTVLGFFLLALGHDAAGKMGNANGTAGFIDMLPPCTTGSVDIYPQILVIDVDGDFTVKFGVDEYRCK